MSFLRHGEIYHFDEGAIPRDHALAHRNDEFPAGYSLAGCAPAEPAAASPAGAHLARKGFRSTMQFQRTVRSALTDCLTQGDNPKEDCVALRRLCEFIRALEIPNADPVVRGLRTARADAIAPEEVYRASFGRKKFALDDLQYVNKCAYFDYQREKVGLSP